MKKATMVWMIVAIACVIVGGLLFCGGMMMHKWDFSQLSTVRYETNEYVISEEYGQIRIVTDTADVELIPTEAGESSVVCYEKEKLKHEVSVTDGALVIQLQDTRRWYEHIEIGFGSPKITVYLPKTAYGALTVTGSTGEILVSKGLTFEEIQLHTDTGDVTSYASASKRIEIRTSTGDICVEGVKTEALTLSATTGEITATDVICRGDVSLAVTTGGTELKDMGCLTLTSRGDTGDLSMTNVIATKRISIERSTGDVRMDGVDTDSLLIETDTGDVTGTLLTEKIFTVKTDTGRVEIPSSKTGGSCEVITDTGDIRIEIRS